MQFYVKDIMSTEIVSVKEDTKIRDLVKIFSDNAILGAPVVDKSGYIIGVVSTQDILKNESSHTFYYQPQMGSIEKVLYDDASFFDQNVSTIMSKDIYSIEPDETVAKMAKSMYDKKIHRLLVVDYEKLVGIVSTFDVLKLLATSDEEIII